MKTPMQPLTVSPGDSVSLADFDSRYVEGDWDKKSASKQVKENLAATSKLQYRLYAENKRSVLLVLQGMDTSGKDGTIRAVTTGMNPQGFHIVPFKRPGHQELDRDFLWRIHAQVPPRGSIGIFNRSHYEDVLVVRVHSLVPKPEWESRYDRINDFEQLLTDSGTKVLKCFLHINKDDQAKRLQARLDDPDKRWKFSKGDLAERKLWDEYQQAYADALACCNTAHAPWHIIPSGRKWYRNLIVSQLLREALEEMAPKIPPCEEGLEGVVVE